MYPQGRRSVRPSLRYSSRASGGAADTYGDLQECDNPQTGGTSVGAVIRCAALVTFL